MKVFKVKHKNYGSNYCFFGGLRKGWTIKPTGFAIPDAHWAKRGRHWAKKSSAIMHMGRFSEEARTVLEVVEFELVEQNKTVPVVPTTNPILIADVNNNIEVAISEIQNLIKQEYPENEPALPITASTPETKPTKPNRINNLDV